MGQWLCLGGALLGVIGLSGSLAGSTWLTTLVPGLPPMMPNTAVGLILVGGAGALRQREGAGPVRRGAILLAALAVLAIGGGTLIEYVQHVDLGIDQLLVPGRAAGPYPGRPSPPTALALMLLAAALLVYDTRPDARFRPPEALLLAAAYLAFLALLGLLFGAGMLYRLRREPVIGVALPTACGLLLVSLGLLLGRPRGGLMRLITSAAPGGMVLRRLLGPAIVAPALSGLAISWLFRRLGVADCAAVLSTLAAATTVVSLLLLGLTAGKLNQGHQALELSRARTRDLVEHASDGIFLADLEGRYTEVNTAGCRMLGYAREQLIGKRIFDLIPPEDVPRLWESRDQMLQGGTHVAEWTLRRQDGSQLPVEVSARILPDGRWQGFVRDISERRRVQEALRRQQAEQTFLAEVGPALAETLEYQDILTTITRLAARSLADFCLVDIFTADGEDGQVEMASRDASNAWICERLQQRPTDVDLSRSWWSGELPLVPRLLQPSELVAWLASGEAQRRALEAAAAHSAIAAPLVARGKLLGALALLASPPSRALGPEDLRLAEELARRAALAIDNARLYRAAQRATQARDDVVSIVAHDLRNPLGTITVNASLLRRAGPDPERRSKRALEAIERSASRMSRLIRDLLDVSRMEGGRLEVVRSRVPVPQLISESLETCTAAAPSDTREFRLEVAPDVLDIWGDRDRLLQVLENLIGNAIKFTEEGGCITVGARPANGEVLFWVKDTGAGIAPEDMAHVFDRFWQARRADRRGAGLGLPIVKGIVEAHGGRVWVESTPGRGSTFYFTVPPAPELRAGIH